MLSNILEEQINEVIKGIDMAESAEENSALNATGLKIVLGNYDYPFIANIIETIDLMEMRNPTAQINSSGAKVLLNALLRD